MPTTKNEHKMAKLDKESEILHIIVNNRTMFRSGNLTLLEGMLIQLENDGKKKVSICISAALLMLHRSPISVPMAKAEEENPVDSKSRKRRSLLSFLMEQGTKNSDDILKQGLKQKDGVLEQGVRHREGGLVRGAERADVSDTLKDRKALENEMDLKLERVKGKYRPEYKKLDQKEQLRIARGTAGRLIQDPSSDDLAFAIRFDFDAALYQLDALEIDSRMIVDLVHEGVLGHHLFKEIEFLQQASDAMNGICDYIRKIDTSDIKKNMEDSWEQVQSYFKQAEEEIVIPHQTVGDMPIPKRQLVRTETIIPDNYKPELFDTLIPRRQLVLPPIPTRQLKTVFHKPGLGDTIARAPPIYDTPITKRQLVRHKTLLPNNDKPGLGDTIARAPPIYDTPITKRQPVRHKTLLPNNDKPGLGDTIARAPPIYYTPIPKRQPVRHNTVLSDDYKPGLGDNIMARAPPTDTY
eukprot:Pgem_evm1s13152